MKVLPVGGPQNLFQERSTGQCSVGTAPKKYLGKSWGSKVVTATVVDSGEGSEDLEGSKHFACWYPDAQDLGIERCSFIYQ